MSGIIINNNNNTFKRKKNVISEIEGDLFTCLETTSLAHCISGDASMRKGIAVNFKSKFGGVQEILNQGCQPGDVAVLKRAHRFIYNLVTKAFCWENSTSYSNLKSSLLAMKRHALQHNVSKIAMPRIGCGLDDGLVWDQVRRILIEVFKDTNIELTVYVLPTW